MARIDLIDDEIGFLKTMDLVLRTNGHESKTFSNAITALIDLAKDQPDIIISDVMMPGINGLQFTTVAQSIAKQAVIIIISANRLEDIEAKHGVKLDESFVFFRKPLGDEFFEFIENAAQNKKQIPKQADDLAPMSKFDYLDQLSKLYRRYHDLLWELAQSGDLLMPSSEQEEECQQILTKLDGAFDVLQLSETDKARILSDLNKSYGNWENRVLENKSFFLPEPSKYEGEPFLYDPISPFMDKCIITSFEMKLNSDGEAKLLVNKEEVSLEIRHDIDNKAGRLILTSSCFKVLKEIMNHEHRSHIANFWHPFDTNFSITVNGKKVPTPKELTSIPEKSTLVGRENIDMFFDLQTLEVKGFLDNRQLKIPLDEIKENYRQRGFELKPSKYANASLAIAYLWAVCLGGRDDVRINNVVYPVNFVK